MLINDLQETIANNINSRVDDGYFTENKQHIYIKFLDKEDEIGFVPNPGSHLVEQDYGGTQFWQYNYEFAVKTKHRASAKARLFELSQYLQLLNQTRDLVSKNESWRLDHIEVSSDPAEVMEDLKGTATYSMDVAVFVYKNKGVF